MIWSELYVIERNTCLVDTNFSQDTVCFLPSFLFVNSSHELQCILGKEAVQTSAHVMVHLPSFAGTLT